MAIPKKIHYCWLSGEQMPEEMVVCMKTWQKVMPEYEMVLWDTNKFNINSVSFVAEAFRVKKWAFAADYIRLYAVYTEGGIYLDTDVFVRKSFDDFLDYDFFTSLEYNEKTAIVPPPNHSKMKIWRI
jgi:mannosyltransferase OCH1-like enzyme